MHAFPFVTFGVRAPQRGLRHQYSSENVIFQDDYSRTIGNLCRRRKRDSSRYWITHNPAFIPVTSPVEGFQLVEMYYPPLDPGIASSEPSCTKQTALLLWVFIIIILVVPLRILNFPVFSPHNTKMTASKQSRKLKKETKSVIFRNLNS